MSKNSSLTPTNSQIDDPNTGVRKVAVTLGKVLFSLVFLLAVLWAGLIFWVHLAEYSVLRWLSVICIALFSIMTLKVTLNQDRYWQQWLVGFMSLWLMLAAWFVWLPPKQNRL